MQLGPFRGWLDVEDTAFFVDAYDEQTGEITLSDETREPLAATSLRTDPDGVLRCTVKSRFPARFTREAQTELLQAIDSDGEELLLRANHRRIKLPSLS